MSVIDYEIDTLSQYVATYIPAADYVDSYVNEYGEIDCSAWGDFSGVVLYTMLSGHHVAAYSYDNGELTGQSFLYNPDQSPEENTTDFLTVMNGMELFVLPAEEETRSSLPSHIQFIYVEVREDNTIISHQYLLLDDNSSLLDDDYTTPSTGPIEIVEPIILPSTGGGGGGQTTTTTDEAIRKERKELTQSLFTTDSLTEDQIQEVGKMLEQIMQDCMGGELYNKLVNNVKPIKLTFHSDKNSQYNYDSHSIILKSCNSDTLLHEMFHAYQHSVLENDEYDKAGVNYEIEAQIARYIYIDSNSMIDRESDFIKQKLGRLVKNMAQHISSRGYLLDYSYEIEERLNRFYKKTDTLLNQMANSNKLDSLTLVPNMRSDDNLRILIELSKNCL